MRADPRPKEFLDALASLPPSVRAVKRLYATGKTGDGDRLTLAFVAPKRLTFRVAREDGRETLRFETDGKISVAKRAGEKRSLRTKGVQLPGDAPRLASLLFDPTYFSEFGAPSPDDGEYSYHVESETVGGVAFVKARYQGGDSIGRDRAGFLRWDAKTGIPREWNVYHGTSSPMDSSGFDSHETWSVLQVTR